MQSITDIGWIHPPADDIPGRMIGIEVGAKAIDMANIYFKGHSEGAFFNSQSGPLIYPSPIQNGQSLIVEINDFYEEIFLVNSLMQIICNSKINNFYSTLPIGNLAPGTYFVVLDSEDFRYSQKLIVQP